jgi:hypothetical protein
MPKGKIAGNLYKKKFGDMAKDVGKSQRSGGKEFEAE